MKINPFFIPIIKGTADNKKRLAASKGILPGASSDEILTILLFLIKDKDNDISQSAKETLQKYDSKLIESFAKNSDIDPRLLTLLYKLNSNKDVRIKLLLNKNFSSKDLETIAKTETDPDLLTIISDNQKKLIENYKIAENLLENENLPLIALKKTEEFFSRTFPAKVMLEENIVSEEEIKEQVAITQEPEPIFEKNKDNDKTDIEEIFSIIKETGDKETNSTKDIEIPNELLEDKEESEEGEEEEVVFDNMYKRIMKMSVAEKIKLALLGNKEARGILIKDSNKVVSMSVLQSPKITKKEISALSKSKNISEDSIKYIANNKLWMRDYEMKLNITMNPKAPPNIAVRNLNQLRANDIKKIARDKNVSGFISQTAKRIINAREMKNKKK